MSDLSVWVPVTDTLKLDPGFVFTGNVVLVPGYGCLSWTRIPASLPNATLPRPHWVSKLHQSNSDVEWMSSSPFAHPHIFLGVLAISGVTGRYLVYAHYVIFPCGARVYVHCPG